VALTTVHKVEAACTVDTALLGRRIGLVLACSQRGPGIAPSVDVHILDARGPAGKTKAASKTLRSVAIGIFEPCAYLTLIPWMRASGVTEIAADAVLDLPLVHGAPPEPAMT